MTNSRDQLRKTVGWKLAAREDSIDIAAAILTSAYVHNQTGMEPKTNFQFEGIAEYFRDMRELIRQR